MNIFNLYSKLIPYLIIGILCDILINDFVNGHEEGENSLQFNKEIFSTEIKKHNHFIMFYAPWCTHCKRLSPTWEELANHYNTDPESQVVIAKVDCTTDTELCSLQDVTGYPTLKFYKAGEDVESAVKFRGTRDVHSLVSFIQSNLGLTEQDSESDIESPSNIDGLIELTDNNFEKYVDKGSYFIKFYAPWCGHCQKLAPTWQELAKSFEDDKTINIAKIDCTQHKSTCSLYDVKGYPTLIWFQDGKKVEVFHGHRTMEDLKGFVLQMVGSKTDDKKNEETINIDSPVLNLISNEFETQVKTGFTFVKFYAPWCGHCKRLANTWDELSKKFNSKSGITIAKVDCTTEENKQLCNDQEVDGYPTLFLYHNGEKISEYTGSRGLDDLITFVKTNTNVHDEL